MTSRDLHDLLHDLAGEEGAASAATAPDPALEARTLGARIARQRLVRASAASVGAAAAVVVLAVAVQAAGPEPAPPATPTPTTTPSPSASAMPSPSPTASPAPATPPTPEPPAPTGVTVDADLPPAQALPEGLLGTTTRAWAMVTYETGREAMPAVLYLVSPEGALYEVPTPVALRTSPEAVGSTAVLDWLPGTSLAVVSRQVDDMATEQVVVDLLTGEVDGVIAAGTEQPRVRFVGDGTSDLLVSRYSVDNSAEVVVTETVERVTSAGRTVASLPAYVTHPGLPGGALDLTGSRLLVASSTDVRVVDTRDLSTTVTLSMPGYGSGGCQQAWFVGADVVLGCATGPGATDLWLTGEDGLRNLARGVPGDPWSSFGTDTGVVVTDTVGGTATEVLTDGTTRAVAWTPGYHGATTAVPGGALVVQVGDGEHPMGLARYDAASTSIVTLVEAVRPEANLALAVLW